MKRILLKLCRWFVLFIVFVSCGKPSAVDDGPFTISGLITDYLSAEPIRGAKVYLYYTGYCSNPNELGELLPPEYLFSSVVTYDDGFYSFTKNHECNRHDDEYFIAVEREGYAITYSQEINMCDKSTELIDLQMRRVDTEMTITTFAPKMQYHFKYGDFFGFDGECDYSDYQHAPLIYGFVYGPNRNPTIQDDCFISGIEYAAYDATRFSFYGVIEGTVQGKSYYVRAYAKNYLGEEYGDNMAFVAK
ncbi:MAG: hypothetical protein KBT27_14150 [Prevotellaceae bacterium]|nr:hypothetical protein [Candidatus Faecinaster equi]